MGVGAKQAQAAVQELRTELQKDPNLSVWEKAWALLFGFIKGEFEAAKRDWDRLWNQASVNRRGVESSGCSAIQGHVGNYPHCL